VLRKLRSGAARFRAQAVRSVNVGATIMVDGPPGHRMRDAR
jgi:hypothetical protein